MLFGGARENNFHPCRIEAKVQVSGHDECDSFAESLISRTDAAGAPVVNKTSHSEWWSNKRETGEKRERETRSF